MKTRVFVSHAPSVAADREFARKLTDRLRAEDVDVFFDETDVLPGDNWAAKAGAALDRATHVVVLISPRALKSPSVQHEIGFVLSGSRFKDRLYPIMTQAVPSEDLPAWASTVPWLDASKAPDRALDEVCRVLGRVKLRRAS